MTALNYSSPQRTPGFAFTASLITALTCFSLLAPYKIACWYLTDPPYPLTHRLKEIFSYLIIPAAVAFLNGLGCLFQIHFQRQTPIQFAAMLTLTLIPLSAPVLLFSSFPPPERVYCSTPRMVLEANARGLAQSCIVNAADHAGYFPPHPALLLLDGSITPKDLSDYDLLPCTLPKPLPPESAWASIAPEADAHSIFIYTGADLLDPKLSSSTFTPSLDPAIIIAYTKPRRLIPNGRILAFADGSAEYIPTKDLPKYLTNSNTARAKLHLPPFTLDGPPPTAPTK